MPLSRHSHARSAPPEQRVAKIIRPRAFQRDGARLRDVRTLVEEARAGDVMAQEALYDRYSDEVERLLYRLLGHDPDIADALQDVFVQVFRGLDRLRDPRALRAWLRAVTVATARKRIRSKARRRWLRFLPQEQLPEQAASEPNDEVLAALKATYAVLDAMSADLRIVFALRHIEQLELTMIADACRVSLATVKRRIRKADQVFAARARRVPQLQEWIRDGDRWEVTA